MCLYAGGIAGYTNSATIESCTNNAVVKATNFGGGITGNAKNSKISDCSNNSYVYGNTAGGNSANATGSQIFRCANTITIMGGNYTGGIVAKNYSKVYDCYNAGRAKGESANTSCYSGGIVGLNDASASISRCYSRAGISANTTYDIGINCIGAIAGGNAGSVTQCYFLSNMTDGIGKKTTGKEGVTKIYSNQVPNQTSYPALDFDNVWKIESTGPVLK